MPQQREKMNINDERDVRMHKLQDLLDAGINPYPAQVTRKQTIDQALKKDHGASVTVTGRIMIKRDLGKMTFCQLKDESGIIQVVFKKDEIEDFNIFDKKIDGGDIIGVVGERMATKTGEESILVKQWKLLSKSLLPLPDKFHGLHDEETRYRKRYIDFLVNSDQKDKVITRSNIVRYIREFLHQKGFIEVETPMLETIASGAMARTFDTYLNAFNLPVHLRICIGELWQKRLMVAGFEKTFEIGRAFRNEGVDHQHNPEFTMLEYYWAYADYEDNMELHEKLLPYVIEKAVGSLQITHDGHDINFEGPYPRVTFREAILEHTGIDINDYDDLRALRTVMEEKGYETDNLTERGKLLDSLYKQTARPNIIQPTFVTEYPVELKPLAKKASDPRYTEMFQLIVNGFELSNSYTELNDPVDQRERFEQQAENKAEGDDEAMGYDKDYVEALEHGMPPATGTGIGIDRLAALLTNSHTIREVTYFPLMKPEGIKDTGRAKTAMAAHVILYTTKKQESWKRLNALSHLTAAMGARTGRSLFQFEESRSSDGEKIPMNIQHAIMIKETSDMDALRVLKQKADKIDGFHVEVFTQDMQDTTNDNKVVKAHESKTFEEIDILGVLIYGERKQLDAFTKDFNLAS